ncbi:MAG: DUF2461 domain-containing protein [Vicinamibacterales bacterium]
MPDLFTPKTLAFLRALKKNNDRAWFHARRDQYEAHVREPMARLVERLANDFPAFAPEFQADPKISLFRPWRDTRFSEDKSPLKTNIAAVFPVRALGRMRGAGLYLEVAPQWTWIGGGLYAPDTAQLHAVREHVAANYEELASIVTSPAFRKIGGLKGEVLTRVPRGFPKDHPAAGYLRHKQFLGFREEPAAFATRPDFYRQLVATFKTLTPMCRFLNGPIEEMGHVRNRAHLLDQE